MAQICNAFKQLKSGNGCNYAKLQAWIIYIDRIICLRIVDIRVWHVSRDPVIKLRVASSFDTVGLMQAYGVGALVLLQGNLLWSKKVRGITFHITDIDGRDLVALGTGSNIIFFRIDKYGGLALANDTYCRPFEKKRMYILNVLNYSAVS